MANRKVDHLRHLKDPNVLAFVKEVASLFKLTKNIRSNTKPEVFWGKVQKLTLSVYSLGLNLPKVNYFLTYDNKARIRLMQSFHNLPSQNKYIYKLCSDVGEYAVVFDPFAKPETCMTSAHEDFYGAIEDLQSGYSQWKTKDPKYQLLAISQWKSGFEGHTSWHILSLSRALLFYLSAKKFGRNHKVKRRRKLSWPK